eukprot:jgi/Bigna1/71445/fgenesh1_pg.15_\
MRRSKRRATTGNNDDAALARRLQQMEYSKAGMRGHDFETFRVRQAMASISKKNGRGGIGSPPKPELRLGQPMVRLIAPGSSRQKQPPMLHPNENGQQVSSLSSSLEAEIVILKAACLEHASVSALERPSKNCSNKRVVPGDKDDDDNDNDGDEDHNDSKDDKSPSFQSGKKRKRPGGNTNGKQEKMVEFVPWSELCDLKTLKYRKSELQCGMQVLALVPETPPSDLSKAAFGDDDDDDGQDSSSASSSHRYRFVAATVSDVRKQSVAVDYAVEPTLLQGHVREEEEKTNEQETEESKKLQEKDHLANDTSAVTTKALLPYTFPITMALTTKPTTTTKKVAMKNFPTLLRFCPLLTFSALPTNELKKLIDNANKAKAVKRSGKKKLRKNTKSAQQAQPQKNRKKKNSNKRTAAIYQQKTIHFHSIKHVAQLGLVRSGSLLTPDQLIALRHVCEEIIQQANDDGGDDSNNDEGKDDDDGIEEEKEEEKQDRKGQKPLSSSKETVDASSMHTTSSRGGGINGERGKSEHGTTRSSSSSSHSRKSRSRRSTRQTRGRHKAVGVSIGDNPANGTQIYVTRNGDPPKWNKNQTIPNKWIDRVNSKIVWHDEVPTKKQQPCYVQQGLGGSTATKTRSLGLENKTIYDGDDGDNYHGGHVEFDQEEKKKKISNNSDKKDGEERHKHSSDNLDYQQQIKIERTANSRKDNSSSQFCKIEKRNISSTGISIDSIVQDAIPPREVLGDMPCSHGLPKVRSNTCSVRFCNTVKRGSYCKHCRMPASRATHRQWKTLMTLVDAAVAKGALPSCKRGKDGEEFVLEVMAFVVLDYGLVMPNNSGGGGGGGGGGGAGASSTSSSSSLKYGPGIPLHQDVSCLGQAIGSLLLDGDEKTVDVLYDDVDINGPAAGRCVSFKHKRGHFYAMTGNTRWLARHRIRHVDGNRSSLGLLVRLNWVSRSARLYAHLIEAAAAATGTRTSSSSSSSLSSPSSSSTIHVPPPPPQSEGARLFSMLHRKCPWYSSASDFKHFDKKKTWDIQGLLNELRENGITEEGEYIISDEDDDAREEEGGEQHLKKKKKKPARRQKGKNKRSEKNKKKPISTTKTTKKKHKMKRGTARSATAAFGGEQQGGGGGGKRKKKKKATKENSRSKGMSTPDNKNDKGEKKEDESPIWVCQECTMENQRKHKSCQACGLNRRFGVRCTRCNQGEKLELLVAKGDDKASATFSTVRRFLCLECQRKFTIVTKIK